MNDSKQLSTPSVIHHMCAMERRSADAHLQAETKSGDKSRGRPTNGTRNMLDCVLVLELTVDVVDTHNRDHFLFYADCDVTFINLHMLLTTIPPMNHFTMSCSALVVQTATEFCTLTPPILFILLW
uniref:AlNc14C546G12114 protein n=1 Tax=Albugo laibachii Nc14 TaxID=890382 RepID=F0X124_9STRA|nr:AlNc14C546G12114 [Albugo laibachii Nc14]|eukprot:CCA27476.1 AlNc14C546G12114 [Albugo laibachii Nc14]